jgi:hypothetical protein
MARGLHRIRDGWETQHSVLVRYDDGKETEIPQDHYDLKGYMPIFEELPWKDEVVDAKRS